MDLVSSYNDVHFNVFWPYGRHAYLENNLTAALAKYLFYAPATTRKSFVTNCLNVPYAVSNGDYDIFLQRKDLSPEIKSSLRPNRRHVILLEPRRLFDSELQAQVPKSIVSDVRHTTPDLWLVNQKDRSLVIVEVKLWKAAHKTAHRQVSRYAREHACQVLPVCFIDDVYEWLLQKNSRGNQIQLFLRESLVLYLEDLDCTQSPVFRKRHIAVEDDRLIEPEMFKRRVEWLMEKLQPLIRKYGTISDLNRIEKSKRGKEVYASGRFCDDDIIGNFSFGFHADNEKPTVDIMSFLNSNALASILQSGLYRVFETGG